MRTPDELRALIEEYLEGLALDPQLSGLEEAMRYALAGGGKRVRPLLCLAVAEACGCEVEDAMPAAAAIELVHTFSLVHDDLPGLDDDEERRGRPTVHVEYDEAVAVLAGDALLAQAMQLALSCGPELAGELASATLGMIGGQYLDITHSDATEEMHKLKTGRLLTASVVLGALAAGLSAEAQASWRRFGDELGMLFQLVDDLLDGDGYVLRHGVDETRRLADAAAARALVRLDEIEADTSVLEEIVVGLAARTS